jgi:hypothetical protein
MPFLPKSNVLTHHMLVEAGACPEQRKVFVEVFGYRVKVTQMSLRKAEDAGLWLLWFGEHFAKDKNAWITDMTHYCLYRSPTREDDIARKLELVLRHVCW